MAARKKRGGRRPGAGAPKGNLNALKTGRYSTRVRALRGAMQALPKTANILAQLTGRDRRKTELIAYGLQFYSEILFHIARGGSVEDLDNIRVRNRAISTVPIQQAKLIANALEETFDA